MVIIKKLTFALPWLILFTLACSYLPALYQNPYFILSTDLNFYLQLLTLVGLILLSSLFFVILVTLASNLKLILPVAAIASLVPLLLLNPPSTFLLAGGAFLSFTSISLLLQKELDQYLTFKPTTLLAPSIKKLTTILLLIISASFYLLAEVEVEKNGFKVPSSLVEMSLSLAQNNQSLDISPTSTITQPQIPPDQLKYLKENPELLKQYGLDPVVLDQLDKPQSPSSSQNQIKALVEEQINNFIKPYQRFIPLVLTLLLFVTLKWMASLLSILLTPLLWLTFWALEKIGFTQYQTEMREVKKLVV